MGAGYFVSRVPWGVSVVEYEEIVVPNTYDTSMIPKWLLFQFALNVLPEFSPLHAIYQTISCEDPTQVL